VVREEIELEVTETDERDGKQDSGISGILEVRSLWTENNEEMKNGDGAKDEFRLAWLWVEGWRAQLRMGGDIVEKERRVWTSYPPRPKVQTQKHLYK